MVDDEAVDVNGDEDEDEGVIGVTCQDVPTELEVQLDARKTDDVYVTVAAAFKCQPALVEEVCLGGEAVERGCTLEDCGIEASPCCQRCLSSSSSVSSGRV